MLIVIIISFLLMELIHDSFALFTRIVISFIGISFCSMITLFCPLTRISVSCCSFIVITILFTLLTSTVSSFITIISSFITIIYLLTSSTLTSLLSLTSLFYLMKSVAICSSSRLLLIYPHFYPRLKELRFSFS